MNFLRKVFLEVVNMLCNNRFIFFIARKFHLFDAVFVTYPATPLFANYYTFRFRQRVILWKPWITGVIRHPSGKVTLQLAIAATEDMIVSASNGDAMRDMYRRTVVVQQALGATTNHFAGIIPGCFVHLRVQRPKNELDATAKNVINAIVHTRNMLGHSAYSPVIVLGSRGYVGREVAKTLQKLAIKMIGVDLGDTYIKPTIAHVVVNITRPEVINDYVDKAFMDTKTAVLNEVYPAPHASIVEEMKGLGAKVFHIAGVQAVCHPSFPGTYKSAVPCCAALPSEAYAIEVVEL